ATMQGIAGTPQSATVLTSYAIALTVVVNDALGNPVSGALVTFTAPSGSASGTFSGSPTASAMTDVQGRASAPAFTANGTAGTFTVAATTAGFSGSAHFTLTNTSGAPSRIA